VLQESNITVHPQAQGGDLGHSSLVLLQIEVIRIKQKYGLMFYCRQNKSLHDRDS